MDYLTPDSPDAFIDFPPLKVIPDNSKVCPVCKGHGGWNLRLNAYPLYTENTPENRHKFSHFRAGCNHCNSWGYVDQNENCPTHDWEHYRNVGNCLNQWICKTCKKIITVDSSD
jgi:RNA polymerase subunit RPABC4/transcription elongation factor Spt4